ncbi:MBL fold metallo-hydrolase [Glaciecola sp. 1036]|uniref:MBL fold metallo-hydrolase n=1 Tax=Alteromonadaceae TaxID=72275 RepID=UPI003CFF9CA3
MKRILVIAALVSTSLVAFSQDRFADVEVTSQSVSGSVYMLTGAGGNIGVSAGDDGLLIIDDQYAPLADKIAAELKSISDMKTKYVVNTHYHGDHTGSNAFFHENQGATIFAHENVRIRLASAEDADQQSLPVITYKDGIKFHINGDTAHVFHLPSAHTDGDSAIWFEKANVLHTGDIFFNGMFPYVDLGAGGDVEGYIEAIKVLLAKIDPTTKIIPGHGKLANKQDLMRFVDMIEQTHQYVQAQKAKGMSEAEVVEAGLEEKWKSWAWQFINEERWIKTLYQ